MGENQIGAAGVALTAGGSSRSARWNKRAKIRQHWQLYAIVSLPLLYFVLFKYVPMIGVIVAFKDFSPVQGILGSPWAGLKHFMYFMQSPKFWTIIKNTLGISAYGMIAGFPLPIILALSLNEIRSRKFKKTVQMVTYAPYFISTVVMVSMLMMFLSPRVGFINLFLAWIGIDPIPFMSKPGMFWSIFVWSDVWQGTGYAAIIYLAALAGIDPQLYEAARVDGASRFQRMLNIDIPGIMPAAVIIFILNMGNFMHVGFEKVYLMQNPLNLGNSEVLATYVYKIGLLQANYSFSGAIGLFNSFVNLILIIVVNTIAKRLSGSGLW